MVSTQFPVASASRQLRPSARRAAQPAASRQARPGTLLALAHESWCGLRWRPLGHDTGLNSRLRARRSTVGRPQSTRPKAMMRPSWRAAHRGHQNIILIRRSPTGRCPGLEEDPPLGGPSMQQGGYERACRKQGRRSAALLIRGLCCHRQRYRSGTAWILVDLCQRLWLAAETQAFQQSWRLSPANNSQSRQAGHTSGANLNNADAGQVQVPGAGAPLAGNTAIEACRGFDYGGCTSSLSRKHLDFHQRAGPGESGGVAGSRADLKSPPDAAGRQVNAGRRYRRPLASANRHPIEPQVGTSLGRCITGYSCPAYLTHSSAQAAAGRRLELAEGGTMMLPVGQSRRCAPEEWK